MTKEEKLAILVDAEARCYDAIKTSDVKSEEFRELLNSLSAVSWRAMELMEGPPADGFPSPTAAVIPAPGERETPAHSGEPKPVPSKEPGLTVEEVKKKMVQYQTAHNLDIAALMQSMGYQKLSTIPAERYGELIELAEAKIKEEG